MFQKVQQRFGSPSPSPQYSFPSGMPIEDTSSAGADVLLY